MARSRGCHRIGIGLLVLALASSGCASSRNRKAAAMADGSGSSTASDMANSTMTAISNGTKTVVDAGKSGAQSVGRWFTGGSQTNQITLDHPLDAAEEGAESSMVAAKPSVDTRPTEAGEATTVVSISSSSKDTRLVVPSAEGVDHDLPELDVDGVLARGSSSKSR